MNATAPKIAAHLYNFYPYGIAHRTVREAHDLLN